MRRVVEPELLDALPPDDPRAVGSRADLRRLNFVMGHAHILTRALAPGHAAGPLRSRPLRLVELGAGDGSLLLQLARRWSVHGITAEVTLLDRHPLVSEETRQAFAALGWSVETVASDVFAWLSSPVPVAGVMVANLFLHHFEEEGLGELLRLAAAKADLFIACEPRRSAFALAAARSLGLLGCNDVTQHDAVVSVRAGFAGWELSASWPQTGEWVLRERSAGLFSHCLVAQRNG